MGQRNTKKPDTQEPENETVSTDLIDCVNLIINGQEYILIENHWENIELKQDPISYLSQEVEKCKLS